MHTTKENSTPYSNSRIKRRDTFVFPWINLVRSHLFSSLIPWYVISILVIIDCLEQYNRLPSHQRLYVFYRDETVCCPLSLLFLGWNAYSMPLITLTSISNTLMIWLTRLQIYIKAIGSICILLDSLHYFQFETCIIQTIIDSLQTTHDCIVPFLSSTGQSVRNQTSFCATIESSSLLYVFSSLSFLFQMFHTIFMSTLYDYIYPPILTVCESRIRQFQKAVLSLRSLSIQDYPLSDLLYCDVFFPFLCSLFQLTYPLYKLLCYYPPNADIQLTLEEARMRLERALTIQKKTLPEKNSEKTGHVSKIASLFASRHFDSFKCPLVSSVPESEVLMNTTDSSLPQEHRVQSLINHFNYFGRASNGPRHLDLDLRPSTVEKKETSTTDRKSISSSFHRTFQSPNSMTAPLLSKESNKSMLKMKMEDIFKIKTNMEQQYMEMYDDSNTTIRPFISYSAYPLDIIQSWEYICNILELIVQFYSPQSSINCRMC